MKCALISFITRLCTKTKRTSKIRGGSSKPTNIKLMLKILEKTKDMDFVIFPGWTLVNKIELNRFIHKLYKPHPTIVLEVGSALNPSKSSEGFYFIHIGQEKICLESSSVFEKAKNMALFVKTIFSVISNPTATQFSVELME